MDAVAPLEVALLGKVRIKVRLRVVFAGMLLTVGAAAQAAWPDGPIGGQGSSQDQNATCRWKSVLSPAQADLIADTTVAKHGLTHRGFTAANGWTILERQLAGSLTLRTYYAWTTHQPTVTCGDVSGGGQDNGEYGGAAFAISYTPGANDPTGAQVHWIQGVHHNDPGFGGFDAGGGFFDLLDNNGSTTDPTYDGNGGAADATCFVDVPDSQCLEGCNNSASFRFSVFVSTFNAATKTITFYKSGVQWGYDFTCTPVPEPSSWIALGLGLCGTASLRRRPRRKAWFKNR